MKKFLCVMLAACLLLSLAACSSNADSGDAGTEAPKETEADSNGTEYTATANGMMTNDIPVTVTATLDAEGKIIALEIDASGETDSLGQVAAPKLQEQILEAGTIEGIDAIASCTVTSNAIFEAINDIYAQAGLETK